MAFAESLQIGKKAEQTAENYFIQHNLNYVNVTNNRDYQKIDVDFIVDGKYYEVKQNLHEAIKGHQGQFFWIEISIDDKQGWWQLNKTDYFFFVGDKRHIIIENNNYFKNLINDFIENGDHSEYGLNRFDYKKDQRYNRWVTAKCMRVYLSQLHKTEVNLKHIVRRRKVAS